MKRYGKVKLGQVGCTSAKILIFSNFFPNERLKIVYSPTLQSLVISVLPVQAVLSGTISLHFRGFDRGSSYRGGRGSIRGAAGRGGSFGRSAGGPSQPWLSVRNLLYM